LRAKIKVKGGVTSQGLSIGSIMLPFKGMSQPVKLSDGLVLDARMTGELLERSIAGQVEYWANLGRALEKLLGTPQALALCRSAATKPISECLETVDSPEGRRRVKEHLREGPFPHYEAAPEGRGLIVRIEANGKRTLGKFKNREFQAIRGGAR
jgi:hypothetical protein